MNWKAGSLILSGRTKEGWCSRPESNRHGPLAEFQLRRLVSCPVRRRERQSCPRDSNSPSPRYQRGASPSMLEQQKTQHRCVSETLLGMYKYAMPFAVRVREIAVPNYLDYDCPVCLAAAGARCRSKSGEVIHYHRRRLRCPVCLVSGGSRCVDRQGRPVKEFHRRRFR